MRFIRPHALVPFAIAGLLVAGAVAACLPNAQEDYKDYLEKTGDIRGGPIVEAGGPPPDGSIPDGGASGLYLVWCLPRLALGDLSKSLRFQGDFTFTGNAGGGKIDGTLTPIKRGATDLGDTTASGQKIPVAGAPVKADATFSIPFGDKIVVAGDANPFSGNDITLERGRLDGYLLSSDAFCAELSGEVTAPIYSSFEEAGDVCLFRRIPQASGPIPDLKLPDFHCP